VIDRETPWRALRRLPGDKAGLQLDMADFDMMIAASAA
jgi:hypothetical protein